MSRFVTTNALVLVRRPWSETSQIVTLLTRDLGKVGAVARGARKITSELGPALEPITESQVVLALPVRGDLAHVQSAESLGYFPSIKRSFVRVTLASALCELVNRALPDGEPNETLYAHVMLALAGMEDSDDRAAVSWLWLAAQEMAADIGYGMQFDACVSCGSEERPHPGFSVGEGGPVCPHCHAEAVVAWRPDTQEALRWLSRASREDMETRRLSKTANRDIRALFEEYFRYHIPNFDRLRSLDMLTSLAAPSA